MNYTIFFLLLATIVISHDWHPTFRFSVGVVYLLCAIYLGLTQ